MVGLDRLEWDRKVVAVRVGHTEVVGIAPLHGDPADLLHPRQQVAAVGTAAVGDIHPLVDEPARHSAGPTAGGSATGWRGVVSPTGAPAVPSTRPRKSARLPMTARPPAAANRAAASTLG